MAASNAACELLPTSAVEAQSYPAAIIPTHGGRPWPRTAESVANLQQAPSFLRGRSGFSRVDERPSAREGHRRPQGQFPGSTKRPQASGLYDKHANPNRGASPRRKKGTAARVLMTAIGCERYQQEAALDKHEARINKRKLQYVCLCKQMVLSYLHPCLT